MNNTSDSVKKLVAALDSLSPATLQVFRGALLTNAMLAGKMVPAEERAKLFSALDDFRRVLGEAAAKKENLPEVP